MKNLFCFGFALMFICSGFLKAQKTVESDTGSIVLEINGVLVLNGKETTEYSYCLHHNGKKMDSAFVKKMKAFTLDLKRNDMYTMSYHKDGYPDKFIMIDTKVPKNKAAEESYEVGYEIEINPDLCKHKEEFKDHPVAIVKYFKNKDEFDFSTKYHEAIHHKEKKPKKVEVK
ncbi:MAG: hypothetical protein IAF38_02855 [Bacteroidia bacterium]|nr:hypothetical protein [Bacteroidia bacterium]